MVLSSDQLKEVLKTVDSVKKAFDILGLPLLPLTQSSIKTVIGSRVFPAYEKASTEKQHQIEELADYTPPPPPPIVEKEPEIDLETIEGVFQNYRETGDIDLSELPVERINDEFTYKGQQYTLVLFMIREVLDNSWKISVKEIEEIISKYKPHIDRHKFEDMVINTTINKANKRAVKELIRYFKISLGFEFEKSAQTNPELEAILETIIIKKISPLAMSLPDNKAGYGEYFFDGSFNVVKFQKGMRIYHGSARLANSASEFPVGHQFYKPNPFGTDEFPEVTQTTAIKSPYSVPLLLTEISVLPQSWFTTAEDAIDYAKGDKMGIGGCSKGCVHSYKLSRDCVFFILDDDFNIRKILESDNIPEEVKKSLLYMFSLNQKKLAQPNLEKIRESRYADDRVFSAWFCDFFSDSYYAGYYAPKQKARDPLGFHLEFITCNAILYLERDLSDKVDIFYDPEVYTPNVRILLNQMKYYETTNTNFHAGNLFQHSIWSLLFTESLTGKIKRLGGESPIQERLKRIIVAGGLLHDIGKMSPEHCILNTSRNKYMYHAIEEHPTIGARYFDIGIPILDENLQVEGRLMPQVILREMVPDITENEIDIVRDVVAKHWAFSIDVIRLKTTNAPHSMYRAAIEKYARLFNSSRDKILSAMATMIVSISDVQASQPFTMDKLSTIASQTEISNIMQSKLFPAIISKPKIFRGGDLASVLRIPDTGIEAMNDVLEYMQSA